MEVVKTQFKTYKQQDQNKAAQSNSQAGDIDEGIDLVPFHMPESDIHVIFQHERSPTQSVSHIVSNG
jgi:hypothetical protein